MKVSHSRSRNVLCFLPTGNLALSVHHIPFADEAVSRSEFEANLHTPSQPRLPSLENRFFVILEPNLSKK